MAAANKHKVISPSNLDIIGLSTTTPDTATDFLAIYDASLGGNRKVLIDNLGFSSNAFTIFQPDSGTAPTADSGSDTLTMTSGDSSISVAGNSTTDTIDLEVDIDALTAEATVDSANDYLMMYDASAGVVRKVLVSAVGGGGSTEDVVFNSSAAGTIPLTLEGSTSQTANLFQINNSASTALTTFDSDGYMRITDPTDATTIGIGMIGGSTNHGINFNSTGNNSQVNVRAGNAGLFSFTTNGLAISGTGVYAVRSGIDGTTSAPAYTFNNDRTTGMYRKASNNLALAVDGVEALSMLNGSTSTIQVFGAGQFATGSLPAAASFEGYIAYDTTTQTMKWSNGTSWATI